MYFKGDVKLRGKCINPGHYKEEKRTRHPEIQSVIKKLGGAREKKSDLLEIRRNNCFRKKNLKEREPRREKVFRCMLHGYKILQGEVVVVVEK